MKKIIYSSYKRVNNEYIHRKSTFQHDEVYYITLEWSGILPEVANIKLEKIK